VNEVDLAKRAIKRDEQAFLEIIHLLKVYFQAYPNYINGDISVELK